MEVPGVVGGNLGAQGDLKGTEKMGNLGLSLLDHLLLVSWRPSFWLLNDLSIEKPDHGLPLLSNLLPI